MEQMEKRAFYMQRAWNGFYRSYRLEDFSSACAGCPLFLYAKPAQLGKIWSGREQHEIQYT